MINQASLDAVADAVQKIASDIYDSLGENLPDDFSAEENSNTVAAAYVRAVYGPPFEEKAENDVMHLQTATHICRLMVAMLKHMATCPDLTPYE